MHYLWFHAYAMMTGLLLGMFVDPFSKIAIGVFYILFCWFHVCILLETTPMNFNTGAYCPQCQRVTGLGLRHCNICAMCVPGKWVHCKHLQRCCDKRLRKRWLNLFKLIVLIYSIMTVIHALRVPWMLVLVPLHIIVLKLTYK